MPRLSMSPRATLTTTNTNTNMNTTYTVNQIGFDSFLAAVKQAQIENTVVIETATGKTRWSPAPPVSAARMRKYREHKSAYDAQCRMNATA